LSDEIIGTLASVLDHEHGVATQDEVIDLVTKLHIAHADEEAMSEATHVTAQMAYRITQRLRKG
jgi:hypothetical protein